MFVQRMGFHSKPDLFFYFGIPSTRDMQTLSIPRILFFFYSLISHVHKISITCKFSWWNNLSFSVVLSNWKSKPTRLCLGLYELLSEDIQTPIVHRSLSVPSLFHLFFLYLPCYLWTVYPYSTMAGPETLCPTQNTSPGNGCFPEIHK